MPRGVPNKAAESGKTTKAEQIRQAAKKLGETVRPRDIVADLKEKGVIVSHALVGKTLKRADVKRKRRGKNTAAATNHGAGQVNKAQRIREVAKSLGKKVRPKEIIVELAKEGITVSSAQVSTTLSAAGYRRKRPTRKVATAAVAHPANGNGLDLDALIATKALVSKLGSIEIAQDALAALKKLG